MHYAVNCSYEKLTTAADRKQGLRTWARLLGKSRRDLGSIVRSPGMIGLGGIKTRFLALALKVMMALAFKVFGLGLGLSIKANADTALPISKL